MHSTKASRSGRTALLGVIAGALLAVPKGGIIAVPWKALAKCPVKFHDNEMHPSTGFCTNMKKNVSGVLKKGAKEPSRCYSASHR
jgi:hypothetical protein